MTKGQVVWGKSLESGVGQIDRLVIATRALVEDVSIDSLPLVADGYTLVAIFVVVWISSFR